MFAGIVGLGRIGVVALLLCSAGCRPLAPGDEVPPTSPSVPGSDPVAMTGPSATSASATAFDPVYPAPGDRAGDRPASGSSTAVIAAATGAPGRPTLPADLPRSGPVAPAVDLAALAAEPYRLAWVDDAGLWLYEAGMAEPRRLVAGQGFRRPLLDPGRRALVWQAVDPAHADDPTLWSLWALGLDGSQGEASAGPAEPMAARQILTSADLPEARGWNGGPCPRWLRDLQWMGGEPARLALATSAVGDCGEHPQRDLWVFAIAELAPQRLLENGVAHFRPSPDGRRFAIVAPGDYWADLPRPGRIEVYEPGKGKPQALLEFAAYATEGEAWQYPDLLWIDGGQAMLVVIEPALLEDRYGSERSPALRLGLDGSRSRLTALPSTVMGNVSRSTGGYHGLGTQIRLPRWSADLSLLASVDYWMPEDDGATLQLIDARTGEPQAYDRLEAPVFHGWAPSAERFLYGDATRLFLGAPGEAPRLLFELPQEAGTIAWVRWAGNEHYAMLREGLGTPPLLELHGLDGSSRGLTQSVGIELDLLP